jgi:hypothetical protein
MEEREEQIKEGEWMSDKVGNGIENEVYANAMCQCSAMQNSQDWRYRSE